MKNYTLIILKVLAEWLREKGWDVKGSGVADMEGGIYKAAYFLRGKVFPVEVEFTQSDLEANDAYEVDNRFTAIQKVYNLPVFIRAELERQCDEW